VEDFFSGLSRLTRPGSWKDAFGAKVFKIAKDEQGGRLTYLKVTGGSLQVKDRILLRGKDGAELEEKVDQIRLYSGKKFTPVSKVEPGMVCAVTGLTCAIPGQGLGAEADSAAPLLEPVLTYRAKLPEGTQITKALSCFYQLQEEEPQLHVLWNEGLQEIQVQLMGQVHQEILKSLLLERFSLDVEFLPGNILYKETIEEAVEGVGHYEPLRHYAEVRLLLEPLPLGSGLRFGSICREDDLDKNWQRLILTHLQERSHRGVLTGSPITDLKITLLAGRAHVKHTEGGDFRQATYRAVRQGLRSAKSVLLEPWYSFRLEVPGGNLGRALSDLQRMEADFAPPILSGEEAVLEGEAPAAALIDYPAQLIGYTRGQGRIACVPCGYRPCKNPEQVVEQRGYDPDRDLDNPADSVFCSHGAGVTIKWDEAPAHMHAQSPLQRSRNQVREEENREGERLSRLQARLEDDKELMRIFERTYGPMRQMELVPFRPAKASNGEERREVALREEQTEYLLVDGYNIIFAWERMEKIAKENLDAARARLIDLLCSYQGYAGMELILVFDAYKVKGNPGTVERVHNITVVYTKEAETADMYIEKAAYRLAKERKVRVATSDRLEQMIILGNGAIRVSAKEFYQEVEAAENAIRSLLDRRSSGAAAIGLAAGPEQEKALYESLLPNEEK
ncbi:MAG: TetM/TetW/TetO/TetS family tetracycline resistance ribosomal protection protein, partial [Clostridia bacterium]|nr:TetM/TetW/TetO/TetS family tetracycline resistance ribosomal protection protein [Clostridia bacterium]